MEVAEVQEGGFAEVIVRQFEVSDLGRDHRLDERRQRGVADRQGLVVLEVARLGLRRERVTPQVQRQHQIGLLDDLLAIEVEVVKVHHQRVLIGVRAPEVPHRMLGEPLSLGMHAERLVVGDEHGLGSVPPCGRLLRADPEILGAVRVALDGVGRCS